MVAQIHFTSLMVAGEAHTQEIYESLDNCYELKRYTVKSVSNLFCITVQNLQTLQEVHESLDNS